MAATRRPPLVEDVVGELGSVVRASSESELESESLPILQLALDLAGPDDPNTLNELLSSGIAQVGGDDAAALQLLLVGPNRWSPLNARGAEAAKVFGITYDGLRRKGRTGESRLDELMARLARSILDLVPMEDLLDPVPHGAPVADPGEDAFNRASIFLSYSRNDDEHEGGLVSSLRDALTAEFRFQTGQELFVFHDQASIDLGESWRDRLELALDSTAFLVVLLTPSYLQSQVCRDELDRFLERERGLGRKDLVLPIYYATVSPGQDRLANELLGRQYADWRALRFQAFDSPPVRVAVANLASSIAAAIGRLGPPPLQQLHEPDTELGTGAAESEDDGIAERLFEMQLALPRLSRALVAANDEQQGVTDEVTLASAELDRLQAAGRGAAAGLMVAKRLATRLEPYADRLEKRAAEIRRDLDFAEQGIRAMREHLPTTTEDAVEEAMRDLIASIDEARRGTEDAYASGQIMAGSYTELGRTVKTLRPVLSRLPVMVGVLGECVSRFSTWSVLLSEGLALRDAQRAG